MELQLRRLATRRPCATNMGTFRQSALVDKHEGATLPEGFFLRAGQVYRFHRWIASSSRSMAFPAGRWQLQPNERNTRDTWLGWYETPQNCSITIATRGKVHRPLWNPWDCGPSWRTRFRWTFCRASRRDRRPNRPALRSPRTPSVLNALAQRETDISLIPSWRATSACDRPLRKSLAASRRRCSSTRIACPSRLTPCGFPMSQGLPQTGCHV
jgi:hypothetical protein